MMTTIINQTQCDVALDSVSCGRWIKKAASIHADILQISYSGVTNAVTVYYQRRVDVGVDEFLPTVRMFIVPVRDFEAMPAENITAYFEDNYAE